MTSPTIAPAPEAAFPHSAKGAEWWRTAVIYQIYPRSFADASGDGIGDLPGITSRLDDLADLGVDAIWLTPFYARRRRRTPATTSPTTATSTRCFGTLADFDAMLAEAHGRGIRVIVDLVPNHSSDQHAVVPGRPWPPRPAAPSAPATSFRDGQGAHGELPPNNWESVFGGPAWTRVVEADGTPASGTCTSSTRQQPDLDWSQPARCARSSAASCGSGSTAASTASASTWRTAWSRPTGLPDYTPPTRAAGGSMGGEDGGRARTGTSDGCPRGLPRLARDPRRVRRRPRTASPRRGCRPPERDGAVGARRRDAPGLQLRVPPHRLGRRRLREVIDACARAPTPPSVPQHLGAVQPRRRPARHPPRAHRREPAGPRHRPGLARASPIPERGPAPRPRRATRHAARCPARPTSTRARSSACPRSSTSPARPARTRRGSARTASGYGTATAAASRSPWEAASPAYGFSPTGSSWLPQPAEWGNSRAPRRPAIHLDAEPVPHAPRRAPRERTGLGHAGVGRRGGGRHPFHNMGMSRSSPTWGPTPCRSPFGARHRGRGGPTSRPGSERPPGHDGLDRARTSSRRRRDRPHTTREAMEPWSASMRSPVSQASRPRRCRAP